MYYHYKDRVNGMISYNALSKQDLSDLKKDRELELRRLNKHRKFISKTTNYINNDCPPELNNCRKFIITDAKPRTLPRNTTTKTLVNGKKVDEKIISIDFNISRSYLRSLKTIYSEFRMNGELITFVQSFRAGMMLNVTKKENIFTNIYVSEASKIIGITAMRIRQLLKNENIIYYNGFKIERIERIV